MVPLAGHGAPLRARPADVSAGAVPASDLDWLRLQIDALYEQDANGRIVRFNGPPGDRPPRPYLFFGRTRLGNLWRLWEGLGPELLAELARLLGAERRSDDLKARPEREAVLVERLGRHHEVSEVWSGPAFRFPAVLPDAGEARPLPGEALPRVIESFPSLAETLPGRTPVHAIERAGCIVAVCFCATRPGRACEAGVETAPAWRGQGLAGRVAASWAADMRRRGTEPLYSTAWENAASRAVARKLGLVSFASGFHIR